MKWPNRRPARVLGRRAPLGEAHLNWGRVGLDEPARDVAAVGQGATSGPPLAVVLTGGGAGREAPDIGCAGMPGGGPGLAQGLPTDGRCSKMAIARRSSCSRLRATWQTSVGRWGDAGGGRGPRRRWLDFYW